MNSRQMAKGLAAGLVLVSMISAGNANAVSFDTVGDSTTIFYNGIVEGAVQAGLTAEADFELAGILNGGTNWEFDVTIRNTSSSPILASRVSSLGFDTDPNVDVSESTASGVFGVINSGNVPQLGNVEVCATNVNCAGGGGGGVLLGTTGMFTMILNFDVATSLLDFSNFTARYQSIDILNGATGTSGSGVGVVPIPAAVWLFGSALVGLVGVGRMKRKENAPVV